MDDNLLYPLFQSNIQSSLTGDISASSIKSEDMMQDFKTLLMMSSTDSLFNGDDDSSSGLSMTSLLANLTEQILAMQIQNDYLSSQDSGYSSIGGSEQSLHINQFAAELEIGGNGANSDCGPTSLVMALHHLGIGVAGETRSTNDGEAVCLARKSMVLSKAKDGVDANGNFTDAEHNTYTTITELARGASAAGAESQRIQPDTASIRQAVQSGQSVIVSGTFAGKTPLPWTGDRGKDDNSAPGGATDHFVAVTGYNSQTGLFTIHDPARNTPNLVTAGELSRFMAGNAGALAIGNTI